MTDTAHFPAVTVLRETHPGYKNQGAILVRLDDDREAWVPKSVISEDSEVWADGTDGELIVPQWWATKEGLV